MDGKYADVQSRPTVNKQTRRSQYLSGNPSTSTTKSSSLHSKRSSISDTPFVISPDSNYRSRTTSISLVHPISSSIVHEPELASHLNGFSFVDPLPSSSTSSSSSTFHSSSSTSSSSSTFHSPSYPRRRVSISVSGTQAQAVRYPYPIQSPPRRTRTMSYPHPASTHSRNERSPKSTRTKKIVITVLILLSLFLIGTVIVLSSVSYYLGIPNWAYLTESEVAWRPDDVIKPLKDPLSSNGTSRGLQRRKEWRDVTDEVIEPSEASSVVGTETLPESWKELEEEMEQLDAEEESEESPTYDDDVETSSDALNESAEDAIWGIDGKGTGGYWMQKDWTGKVENSNSWDRLYNVTTRPGETIPRLIHQTWKNDILPDKWQKAWKECREGMPDYEYMLWTDDISREFIAKHYPAHLHMFDNYRYPIQRADSIRYFILHHFGGIYMDLDIGCRRRLDPLLQGDWEVILPITKPVGVSNDLIFSSKGSAFMDDTVHGLSTFDHQYFTNYPTVMFSTGPMFLSAQYALYSSSHPLTETHTRAEVRILPKSLYGKNAPLSTVPHSFFSHFYGSSWHSDDAGFITFLGDWGKKLMWVGLVVIILGVTRLIWIKRKAANGQQYQLLSILPTSNGMSHGPPRSGASTPTSVGSSGPMSPSTAFDISQQLPSDLASAFRRAGHLILAAPATLLYGERDRRGRRRTGLLYFVPALFQPDPRRRGRTASEASQLPLQRPRRNRAGVPPPPYESREGDGQSKTRPPGGDETMDEVDAFLNEADTEGESSTNPDEEDDGNWNDWRRKSEAAD
ncbi:uncharacterized protein IL334_002779 [Kwoniella shivajii]|uniref:MIPC synthase n=1 Tax=Kwoniella shivajii TaxID=564305 RepID=A0ABZ1CVP2_9TREE|nr:hypothetical protein IL334_002779 [Kwoniella shivajii]